MPLIDLNKTLIIHTIIDGNEQTTQWEKMFEINKKVLNHFGYHNIYLLKAEPKLISPEKYRPLHRSELFLYQDMEILKDYDHVIYTELDAFLIKPIEELQKLCDGVDEDAIMFKNYNESMEISVQFMFSLWSVDFYKQFLEEVRKEIDIISKIGHENYIKFCRDIFPKSKKYKCKDDEVFLSYIIKKYKMKNIVNLDCISPNKKHHLKYFVNCVFLRNRLYRVWLKENGDLEKNPKTINFNNIFFLHVIDSDKKINEFEKFFYKKLGIK